MTISHHCMSDTPKYKKGDRCKVIKNALAPECIGHAVTIDSVAFQRGPSTLYRIIIDDDIMGYASEHCLELISPLGSKFSS